MRVAILGKNELSEKILEKSCVAMHDARLYSDLQEIDACQLVIINTDEVLEQRQNIVKAVTEKIDALVAVTSTLTYISPMARYAKDGKKVIGMRFMGVEYVGQYIELTKTFDTDNETYSKVSDFAKSMSTLVVDAPDTIGGIFYRLLPLQANVGAFLVLEGVSPQDVDNAIRYGTNTKRPPLSVADEIGIDVLQELLMRIYAETGRPAYRPCPLIRKMVSAGRLGKKTGCGFFDYSKEVDA